MVTGDNIIDPVYAVTHASSAPKQGSRGFWGVQELAELYRVADHLTRLGLPVIVCTGTSDEGDPWAAFELPGTGDVVVHVARIDNALVVVDVAKNRIYHGADFRAVADQLVADVVPVEPPPRDQSNVVMHPRMAMTTFVAAALVAAGLADPASASVDKSYAALPEPDSDPVPDGDTDLQADKQGADPAPVLPSDSSPVMPRMSKACDASMAGCALVDNPVLPRSEPSERLAGRDTYSISAAMPYGGMGVGVSLTTLAIHLAPTLLPNTLDRSEGNTVSEEDLLFWLLPSSNGEMQELLSASASIVFDGLASQPDRSMPSEGQGSVSEQSMDVASVRSDNVTLSEVAPTLARPVDIPAHAMFLENPIDDGAVTPVGPNAPTNAMSATTRGSSEASATQTAPANSPDALVNADAPHEVSADTSVAIFDHVDASMWGRDQIALLGFDVAAADGGLDGMTDGAIVVQTLQEQTDMHADGEPEALPEDTLTVAWPTSVPKVAADADAPPISPEAYVLADTLSNHVTLADDATNVVVYIGGVVSVQGFTFGRDRIVMVEGAAGPDWLSSVDIMGQDVVLMGLSGGSVTLSGAAATFV